MVAPKINGVHHVAYRCKDAKETVDFYKRVMGMDFQLAFAENEVPSTGEYDPISFSMPAGAISSPFSNCPSSRTWTATRILRPGCSISPSR